MATVLVASADGLLRKLAAVELAEGGLQGLLSADPLEAMQLVKAGSLSAAVVDRDLPAPGGLALIKRIRSEEASRHLPILMVTPEGGGAGDAPGGPAVERLSRPLSRPAVGEALGRLLAGAPRPVGGAKAASSGASIGPAEVRKLCHDLNNPLAVVAGQVEIIAGRYGDLPEDLKSRLAEIRKAVEAMRRLIREAGVAAREAMGAGGAGAG